MTTPSTTEIQYCLKKLETTGKLLESETKALVDAAEAYIVQRRQMERIREIADICIVSKGGWEAGIRKIARLLGDNSG